MQKAVFKTAFSKTLYKDLVFENGLKSKSTYWNQSKRNKKDSHLIFRKIRYSAAIFDWLIFHYFLQLMSVGLVWKSIAKSNEKLVNQTYATLFLSWMPNIFWPLIWSLCKIPSKLLYETIYAVLAQPFTSLWTARQ